MAKDLATTWKRSLPWAACGAVLVLAACEAPVATAADPAEAAAATPATAPETGGSIAAPSSLTADERIIWNSLTDGAKREALEFISNGGTLTQFVAV